MKQNVEYQFRWIRRGILITLKTFRKSLTCHSKVFEPIPPGEPPDRGFEHIIELEEGAKPSLLLLIDTQKSIRMKLKRLSKNF
jgi:hypothetical protein